jgi:HSP20 family protein
MSEKVTVPTTAPAIKPRRWDPFDLLTPLQAEFDRFWGSGWPTFRPLRRLTELPDVWTPRADIFEQNGSLVVKAELPGVKKEDIAIAIEEGDLVIRGERKIEEKVEEKDYLHTERFFGSFFRRLPLPEGVMPEKIEAVYKDGVLEVKVPKPVTKEPETRRIPVK